MKTYLISYTVLSTIGSDIKSGQIRVKNASSEIGAKIKLETYLKNKVPYFGKLIIHSCRASSGLDVFDDILGKDNPFGKFNGKLARNPTSL
jgi:hypothetical protein